MQLANNLPKRDFYAITLSLAVITVLSWVYLVVMAKDMAKGSCCMLPTLPDWTIGYFWMMFLMWAIMMVGMMVPSATPMILIYAAVAKKAEEQGTPIASTAAFTSGYIVMWVVFSFLVTVAQWQLDKAALLSPMMVANSPKFGAALLIAAGIYQWLPVKNNCLKHCQSPFHFISGHWRKGNAGAFIMGISHGIFCVGCCWVLMLLLFVGGVMNILWIAAITVFVLLEKVLPLGDRGAKLSGVLMVTIGAFILLTTLGSSAHADQTQFKRIPTQFIVALSDPSARSGNNAQTWGLWHQDPGPRGCLLENYPKLKATGVAPAQWKFDSTDWWLEEHGALMEKPIFPLPPGKYVVTGGRAVTAVLTVSPMDEKGEQHWQLENGAKLYDVTHLPCHAARYTPAEGGSCSPEKAKAVTYPVPPGVPMPEVEGCVKQEYAVLFVTGVEAAN